MEGSSRAQFAQVRELFHALLDESATARELRLRAVALTDPELSQAVRHLLESADSHLETKGADGSAIPFAPGTIIGTRYRILELLGEGGMGDVYLAERADDTGQKVALKFMRGTKASTVARFIRERKILAKLSHPNIAHLIDAGLTERHVPWLAMEYVDGENILSECDRRRLDLRSRVALFVRICKAVQFAHRNLVLHRDLKPSNILVDREGTPKLLDFGIAKLLDDTVVDKTQTLLLTPSYASPEQLRGDTVTTASDIYQLGLILFELLAGVSVAQMRRDRRDRKSTEDGILPALHSALLRVDPEKAVDLADARNTSLARLFRLLRSDLQDIVWAATAEDPRQRYGTAQALSDDLERWLHGQPVLARRNSFGYRMGKLLRRHAGAAAVSAVLAIALIVSSVVAVTRAQREREQRERAEAVLAFIRDVFRQGDPENAKGAVVDTAELFERAAAKLLQRKDIGELTRGVILNEIASVLMALGREKSAVSIARNATTTLEPLRNAYPEEYLESAENLVTTLGEMDQIDEESHRIADALTVARKIPAGRRPWLGMFLTHEAIVDQQRGRLEDARVVLAQAISEFQRDGTKDSSDFVTTLYDGGRFALDSGDLRGALDWYEKAEHVQESATDVTKKDEISLREIISRLKCQLGDTNQSIETLAAVVKDFDNVLGPSNNRTIMARVSLALCNAAAGNYPRASEVFDAAEAGVKSGGVLIPAQQVHFNDTRARLALYHLNFQSALEVAEKNAQLAADTSLRNWIRVRVTWLLGEALLQSGKWDASADVLRALLLERIDSSVASPIGAETHDSLGRCFLLQGKFEAAKIEFARAIDQWRHVMSENSPQIVRSRIHELWADVLASRDPAILQQFADQREKLVNAIGHEDAPQVWQFDLLFNELDRSLGNAGIDVNRVRRGQDRLRELTQRDTVPDFVGLNSFSP